MFFCVSSLLAAVLQLCSVVHGMEISEDSWETLDHQLEGRVILPTDDDFEESHVLWSSTYDNVYPSAIIECETASDVSVSWKFLLELSGGDMDALDIAIRNCGHNFAGWSISSGIVIDVSSLQDLYIETHTAADGEMTEYARVGSGVNLANFTDWAESHDITLPHGDCASVCFGGYLLGGGFGLTSRMFGLGIDWIESIDIVLPLTGELVTVSNSPDMDEYSDLYWALRGAGHSNFGIVTSFLMKIPSKKQYNPGLFVELQWNYNSHDWQVISNVWNRYVSNVEKYKKYFNIYLRIQPSDYITQDYYISLHGFWTGEQIEGLNVITQLLNEIDIMPVASKIDYVKFEGWIDPSSSDRVRYSSKCKSRFVLDSDVLDESIFDDMSLQMQHMVSYERPEEYSQDDMAYPGQFMFIAPAGGSISSHGVDSSAFYWRNARYLVVICSRWMPGYDHAHKFAEEWLFDTMTELEGHLSDASFVNFPDNTLNEWQKSYYGGHYARLQDIKRKYDPHNYLNYPQSIELQEFDSHSERVRNQAVVAPIPSVEEETPAVESLADSGRKKPNKGLLWMCALFAAFVGVTVFATAYWNELYPQGMPTLRVMIPFKTKSLSKPKLRDEENKIYYEYHSIDEMDECGNGHGSEMEEENDIVIL